VTAEVRPDNDQIMMAVREEKGRDIVRDSQGMPLLRRVEVVAIVHEGLEEFFSQELS